MSLAAASVRESAELDSSAWGDRPGLRVGLTLNKGRGLFAERAFQAGETIGRFALLMLPATEVEQLKRTRIYDYVFFVRAAGSDPDHFDAALALGEISLCNHASPASGAFAVDAEAEIVTLTAARPIAAGEEITIDYGDFVHFDVKG